MILLFFFFNDTATTEIYTLSLHDALPISPGLNSPRKPCPGQAAVPFAYRRSLLLRHVVLQDAHPAPSSHLRAWTPDRKSTRLNSSHGYISYAVFCLKKKKTKIYVQSHTYN